MTTKTCAQCFTEFSRSDSKFKKSKHCVYFCSRECKDRGQRIGGVKAIQPSHYGEEVSDHKKKISFGRCIGCEETRRFLLILHHVDGDHSNGSIDNLEVVCANCHIIRHLKLRDNSWSYDTSYLTPRELLPQFYMGR